MKELRREHSLVKVIGTCSCDMLTAPLEKHSDQLVKGICGQVCRPYLKSAIGGLSLGMSSGLDAVYIPGSKKVKIYKKLYLKYRKIREQQF